MTTQETVQRRVGVLRRWRRSGARGTNALLNPWQILFGAVANAAMAIVFRTLIRLEIVGLQNVPRHGRLIVIGNHSSWLDPVLVGAFIPRRIIFMGKKELTRNPIARFVIWSYGVFAIDRGNVDRSALTRTDDVMHAEGVLCMFPEGTRSRTGELRRAKAGTALVALRHNAPVLPVAIAHAYHGLFSPYLRLRRPRIRITIGKPFTLPPIEGEALGKDALSQRTDEMMQRLAEHLPPEQRGYYAQTPDDTPHGQ